MRGSPLTLIRSMVVESSFRVVMRSVIVPKRTERRAVARATLRLFRSVPAEALALRVLEPLARLRLAALLALDHARVARQEAFGPQGLAVLLVDLDERARDRMPRRAGLAAEAAA